MYSANARNNLFRFSHPGLLEAVKTEFDVDGMLEGKHDRTVLFELFDKYEVILFLVRSVPTSGG